MTSKECAKIWDQIVEIYKDTSEYNPSTTMDIIVKEVGLTNTLTVFSTVAKIKESDGRIYGMNKDFISKIPYILDAVQLVRGNPMYSSKLDSIHTSHINQLIGELRRITEVRLCLSN